MWEGMINSNILIIEVEYAIKKLFVLIWLLIICLKNLMRLLGGLGASRIERGDGIAWVSGKGRCVHEETNRRFKF